jgi:hypothetical protein
MNVSFCFSNELAAGFFCTVSFLTPAFDQPASGGATVIVPSNSFWYNLFLLMIAAVVGGVVSPICQAIDTNLGLTAWGRARRAEVQVQGEVVTALQELAEIMRTLKSLSVVIPTSVQMPTAPSDGLNGDPGAGGNCG